MFYLPNCLPFRRTRVHPRFFVGFVFSIMIILHTLRGIWERHLGLPLISVSVQYIGWRRKTSVCFIRPDVSVGDWPFCLSTSFIHLFYVFNQCIELKQRSMVGQGVVLIFLLRYAIKWRQSRERKWPCPKVCSAHAQPEVEPYPP
jgi:hypothetical protein